MKKYLLICFLLFLSCRYPMTDENHRQWNENKTSMKKIVSLLKENKLTSAHENVSFSIPDSLKLSEPFDQVVVREGDIFSKNNFTVVFLFNTQYRLTEFIYTNDSSGRLKDYESNQEIKLEDNWYFLSF